MRLPCLAALALSLAAAPALAQPSAPDRVYQQSPAVLARFPDVPIRLDAPGLAPGKAGFTTQGELEAHLARVKARAPGVRLASLGRSGQGRDLPFLVFTAEGHQDLARVRRLRRPVVWFVGQQHGNEPAGGEAMLAVASALADGELQPFLRQVTVVVVPRANPDGAAAFTRRTGDDFDLNRDHLLASLPETRAIQAGMAQLPPDLIVDFHEYAVARGWTAYGGLAPWDATFLAATHPGVPPSLTAFVDTRLQPAIDARLAARGLSNQPYLTTPPETAPDRTISTGGTAPGISRNYYGLAGAASLLVETRGIGIGRQGFQRRVATHYLAAQAALEVAARDGARLRRTVAAARRDLARGRDPLVVAVDVPSAPSRIDLLDAQTGVPRSVAINLRDSRRLTPSATRPRPLGYLLAPEARAAAEAFRVKGVRTCALATTAPLAVEAYRVSGENGIDRRAGERINPDQSVSATRQPHTVTPGPGWLFVPMAQPAAQVIAASLEPDSPGSYVATGLIRPTPDWSVPVYRVTSRPPTTAGCR